MRKFHPATITEKIADTQDSYLLTLAVPAGAVDDFRYTQGQHLPVRAQIRGESVRRTYSIYTSVKDQQLQLGIRVQEDGLFSNYVAELKVGDTFDVMPPYGHFNTTLKPEQAKTYAAFVAGSGMSPILSIVKTTLETESESRFLVFYGNRTRATTMFIEQLWALKNLYSERLALHFIMSQEATEIELYSGRCDGTKVAALHTAFMHHERADDIFVCGPNPMIDDVTASLVELGYSPDRIHSERFRSGLRRAATLRPKKVATPETGTEVTVVMDGERRSFHMGPDDGSILESAQVNGLDLPYSCKAGVCSTCRAFLTKGEVDIAVTYALEPWERDRGFILSCQARPKTAAVELDFDQA
jgi:ring-1,2-phenylacetyl-CoA epoxidase subunit PaaE